MDLSSFFLGLAAGFLASASLAFAFGGVFGAYYLAIGGACAGASVVVTLLASRSSPGRATSAKP